MQISQTLTDGTLGRAVRHFFSGPRATLALLMLFTLAALLFADSAHATITTSNVSSASDPLSAVLCNIVSLITGGTGKALATIALIFLAIGLFVGKISWGVAIAVGIGIGGMFGATNIVQMISGDNTSICSGS